MKRTILAICVQCAMLSHVVANAQGNQQKGAYKSPAIKTAPSLTSNNFGGASQRVLNEMVANDQSLRNQYNDLTQQFNKLQSFTQNQHQNYDQAIQNLITENEKLVTLNETMTAELEKLNKQAATVQVSTNNNQKEISSLSLATTKKVAGIQNSVDTQVNEFKDFIDKGKKIGIVSLASGLAALLALLSAWLFNRRQRKKTEKLKSEVERVLNQIQSNTDSAMVRWNEQQSDTLNIWKRDFQSEMRELVQQNIKAATTEHISQLNEAANTTLEVQKTQLETERARFDAIIAEKQTLSADDVAIIKSSPQNSSLNLSQFARPSAHANLQSAAQMSVDATINSQAVGSDNEISTAEALDSLSASSAYPSNETLNQLDSIMGSDLEGEHSAEALADITPADSKVAQEAVSSESMLAELDALSAAYGNDTDELDAVEDFDNIQVDGVDDTLETEAIDLDSVSLDEELEGTDILTELDESEEELSLDDLEESPIEKEDSLDSLEDDVNAPAHEDTDLLDADSLESNVLDSDTQEMDSLDDVSDDEQLAEIENQVDEENTLVDDTEAENLVDETSEPASDELTEQVHNDDDTNEVTESIPAPLYADDEVVDLITPLAEQNKPTHTQVVEEVEDATETGKDDIDLTDSSDEYGDMTLQEIEAVSEDSVSQLFEKSLVSASELDKELAENSPVEQANDNSLELTDNVETSETSILTSDDEVTHDATTAEVEHVVYEDLDETNDEIEEELIDFDSDEVLSADAALLEADDTEISIDDMLAEDEYENDAIEPYSSDETLVEFDSESLSISVDDVSDEEVEDITFADPSLLNESLSSAVVADTTEVSEVEEDRLEGEAAVSELPNVNELYIKATTLEKDGNMNGAIEVYDAIIQNHEFDEHENTMKLVGLALDKKAKLLLSKNKVRDAITAYDRIISRYDNAKENTQKHMVSEAILNSSLLELIYTDSINGSKVGTARTVFKNSPENLLAVEMLETLRLAARKDVSSSQDLLLQRFDGVDLISMDWHALENWAQSLNSRAKPRVLESISFFKHWNDNNVKEPIRYS